jgi:ABC-2 type transport system ATP-binding protein
VIHQGQLVYDGSLDRLVDNFTPYREIQVELAHPLPEKELLPYGEIKAIQGQSVRFCVKREALTRAVAKMLAELEVLDLTVTDPPVEEVIGQVFAAGSVS